MKRFMLGKIFVRVYPHIPFRARLLQRLIALEGGEMFSLTLRDVLAKYHGVVAGNYSYGSLLSIGNCDPNTTIGSYVSIGPNARRFGAAHPVERATLHPLFYNPRLGLVPAHQDVGRSECWIGHDSWIGANVSILPGCTRIGVGAVVGAGSVLTRNVPDFTVVAGNPAREIRKRFSSEEEHIVAGSQFWTLDPDDALAVITKINSRLDNA